MSSIVVHTVFASEVGLDVDAVLKACRRGRIPALKLDKDTYLIDEELVSRAITGTDLRTAMEMLGHTDPKTTLKMYARSSAKQKRKAMDEFLDGICGIEDGVSKQG